MRSVNKTCFANTAMYQAICVITSSGGAETIFLRVCSKMYIVFVSMCSNYFILLSDLEILIIFSLPFPPLIHTPYKDIISPEGKMSRVFQIKGIFLFHSNEIL